MLASGVRSRRAACLVHSAPTCQERCCAIFRQRAAGGSRGARGGCLRGDGCRDGVRADAAHAGAVGPRFRLAAPAGSLRSDRLSDRQRRVPRLHVALPVPVSGAGRPARRAPAPRARGEPAREAPLGGLRGGARLQSPRRARRTGGPRDSRLWRSHFVLLADDSQRRRVGAPRRGAQPDDCRRSPGDVRRCGRRRDQSRRAGSPWR